MPRYAPLLARLQDHVEGMQDRAYTVVYADGEITPAEAALLADIRLTSQQVERLNQARLDLISMLDHGELRPRRQRMRRELMRDLGPDQPEQVV